MSEQWRTVVEHPGYEVSDHGRVRNARTGRVLAQTAAGWKGTYRKVHLGRRAMNQLVHILVATAFHGPPPSSAPHQVDHLNFDAADNRAANLRWLPAAQNMGRHIAWSPDGWVMPRDELVPDGYEFMSESEREEVHAALSEAGW